VEKGQHCCPLNETLLWRKRVTGLNQAATKELSRLLDYPFYLPEMQLRAGLKYPSSSKRLRKFVSELMKGTRPLKVGVVGGRFVASGRRPCKRRSAVHANSFNCPSVVHPGTLTRAARRIRLAFFQTDPLPKRSPQHQLGPGHHRSRGTGLVQRVHALDGE
jgi:hypothetical protein